MGHIILDGIKWNIIVIFRIFAPRYNISLIPPKMAIILKSHL